MYLPGLGKRHPENKDELEGVVKGYSVVRKERKSKQSRPTEPIDSVDSTFKHGQECIDHPVLGGSVTCSSECRIACKRAQMPATHSKPLIRC